MNRAERNAEVERWQKELAEVRHAVLLDYRGVTVPEVTDLRNQIRQGGGNYAVIKNTLLARAIADAPLGKLKEQLKGPTAVAWSIDEPVALAKTLQNFMKTVSVVQVKAVLLDGQALPAQSLDAVASLPSREELHGKIVYMLASPMRRLATVLSGPSRGFANVLSQRSDKLKS